MNPAPAPRRDVSPVAVGAFLRRAAAIVRERDTPSRVEPSEKSSRSIGVSRSRTMVCV